MYYQHMLLQHSDNTFFVLPAVVHVVFSILLSALRVAFVVALSPACQSVECFHQPAQQPG
jgi:hypothetical protein